MKSERIIWLLVALGVLVRLICARGDPWLDEIWTLVLIAPLKSGFEVFRNISHDNNHFLNSWWMYQWGPDANPLIYRLPSILCGGASIYVAGHIGRRTSPAAGAIAAFVVAFAFPFVNYGSEARGYSGLVLAMLVAVDALDRAMPLFGRVESHAELRRLSWIMGVAFGFGALAHLEMFMGAFTLALCAIAYVSLVGAPGDRIARLRAAYLFFLPGVALLAPASAATAAGIQLHGVTIGGVLRLPDGFAMGYGKLLVALAGLPARRRDGWVSISSRPSLPRPSCGAGRLPFTPSLA